MWCEIDSRIWIRVGLIVLKEIGGARRKEKKRKEKRGTGTGKKGAKDREERREENRSEAKRLRFIFKKIFRK